MVSRYYQFVAAQGGVVLVGSMHAVTILRYLARARERADILAIKLVWHKLRRSVKENTVQNG